MKRTLFQNRKIVVMILILIALISILSIVLLWRGYSSDYSITYNADRERVTFELAYNNNYFNRASANKDEETMMVEDKEKSVDEVNILSQLGFTKKKKTVSYKINGNGVTQVTFSLSGRYEDTVCLATYKIEVTDEGVTVTDMKL